MRAHQFISFLALSLRREEEARKREEERRAKEEERRQLEEQQKRVLGEQRLKEELKREELKVSRKE